MLDLYKLLGIKEYKVGDKAWIYIGNHSGKRTEGTVIAELDLPGYSFKHYVIEILTSVDPLLEIRCGSSLEMSNKQNE
jgi:hypothetical protein